jgi:hypothetical protein
MALDHYIPQVHLKQFYAPELGRLLYAVRKADDRCFTPNSKSICRLDEGNTNTYLSEPRAIEEFLKSIEPNYDRQLRNIQEHKLDADTVYVTSGFIAYVLSCSPAAMRIHSYFLQQLVQDIGKKMDRAGQFPPLPDVLGNSFEEAIESGLISVKVDAMYPQAIGVSQILARLSAFGNADWEILRNNTDCPFVTSDYPVGYGPRHVSPFAYRDFPLAPDIAIRIVTDARERGTDPELNFPRFRYRDRKISRKEAIEINRSIVRSAETHVFSSTMSVELRKFIRKNSRYFVEPTYQTIGPYHMASSRVSDRRATPNNSSKPTPLRGAA